MSPDAVTAVRPSWQDVMVSNYAAPRLHLVRGEGHQVWDADGRVYTDLLAGIAVNVLGHTHARVVAAVRDQIAVLAHTSNLYENGPSMRLAARLRAATGLRTMFTNSGTEANEAALKAVRRHAYQQGRDGVVVAFQNSFHGRTLGALALTGQTRYHEGFSPLPAGIVHVPYNDPGAFEAAFDAHDVIGVFAEVVQGEGGVRPMTADAAATLRRSCASHGAKLVIDEVQTGIGRTGTLFAYEQFGLRPDAVTVAKGLGGGMPIGACLLSEDLAAAMGPGSHGCTFGGNAVSAAAAHAVLDVLEEGLMAEAAARAAAWRSELEAAGLTVRGLGSLLGVPVPDGTAGRIVQAMEGEGFLVGQAGGSVVRLAPPLITPAEALTAAVAPLASAVDAGA